MLFAQRSNSGNLPINLGFPFQLTKHLPSTRCLKDKARQNDRCCQSSHTVGWTPVAGYRTLFCPFQVGRMETR